MPVNYIGRTTYYSGKRLMDLLCKLKNFGIGRIVYRKHTADFYEEPCYFIIKSVDPDMANPSEKNKDRRTNTKVIAQSVFRGTDRGDVQLDAHWKPDWRLVPKAEEHLFRDVVMKPLPPVEIQDTISFPPLLERLLMEKMKKEGIVNPERPKLKLDIRQGRNNRALLVSSDVS